MPADSLQRHLPTSPPRKPPPPCLNHQAAPSSRRPIRLSALAPNLTVIVEGHCSCQMGLMTQCVQSNTGESSGMLGMRLGFGREEQSVCVCVAAGVRVLIFFRETILFFSQN